MNLPGPPQEEQTLVLDGNCTAQTDANRPEFLPPGTRLHEFEIIGLIGEGGFGIVYLAYDHQLERRVALKEYLPTSLAVRGRDHEVTLRSQRHAETFAKGLQSFVNEARLLARFDHPALVKVHRFWEANGTAYLVMPWYDGPTLKVARQTLSAPPDEDWIRGLLTPLLDALELVHGHDCLHRDIAPDNILLIEGKPVLLDFGAARRVIHDTNQALTVILKPGYAPIEQYAEMPGIRQGPWTDLYALGAVVRYLVTGHAPPPAVGRMVRDPCQALTACATGRYSNSLLSAVDRCLSIRAEDRPQSVEQLRELLASNPATTPSKRGLAAFTHGSHSRHQALFALATAGLLASFILYASFSGSSVPDPEQAINDTETTQVTTTSTRPPSLGLEDAWAAIESSSADYELAASHIRNPLRTERDSLELHLHSAHDGWVYVLLWDRANDHVGLLLPNKADQQHQIKAGQTLQLPRSRWRYMADVPAGIWEVLLLVSESQRSFPALELSPDGVMLMASRESIERSILNFGLSALTGLPECQADSSCPSDYGALRLTLQEIESQ